MFWDLFRYPFRDLGIGYIFVGREHISDFPFHTDTGGVGTYGCGRYFAGIDSLGEQQSIEDIDRTFTGNCDGRRYLVDTDEFRLIIFSPKLFLLT